MVCCIHKKNGILQLLGVLFHKCPLSQMWKYSISLLNFIYLLVIEIRVPKSATKTLHISLYFCQYFFRYFETLLLGAHTFYHVMTS